MTEISEGKIKHLIGDLSAPITAIYAPSNRAEIAEALRELLRLRAEIGVLKKHIANRQAVFTSQREEIERLQRAIVAYEPLDHVAFATFEEETCKFCGKALMPSGEIDIIDEADVKQHIKLYSRHADWCIYEVARQALGVKKP